MAEPTDEQRKVIRAYIDGTLLPLIGGVLEKKLTQAALFMREELQATAPAEPTDEEIAAWADSFIKLRAYNRPVAVQIAMEAAKWVRSRTAGVSPSAPADPQQPQKGGA